jgi:hypothetical protein
MKYFFPFILRNNIIDSFKITDNIRIRELKKIEREEFFGLKKIEFKFADKKNFGYVSFSKFISSENKKGRINYNDIIKKGLFDDSSDILASNYVLEIETQNSPDFIVGDIDLSFKIFKPCSTGFCLGFCEKENDAHFSGNFSGPFLPYLEIKNKNELSEIKRIYKKILDKKNNNTFQIIAESYKNAISGISTDIKIRFILLVIALECLCLPAINDELKFRFSLRIAKLLSKYCKSNVEEQFNIEEQFKFAKKIYDIRSDIVHNGESDKLDINTFLKTVKITSQLIHIYLNNDDIFKKENLEKICLISDL